MFLIAAQRDFFVALARFHLTRVVGPPGELALPSRRALPAPIPRTLPPDETSALPASRYAPTAKRKTRSGHLCLTAFSCASSARASTAASACTSASSGVRLLSIRARPSPVATSYQKNAGPSKIVVHCAPYTRIFFGGPHCVSSLLACGIVNDSPCSRPNPRPLSYLPGQWDGFWSDTQLKKMRAGGNADLNAFLKKHGVDKHLDPRVKYNSPAAGVFRDSLRPCRGSRVDVPPRHSARPNCRRRHRCPPPRRVVPQA